MPTIKNTSPILILLIIAFSACGCAQSDARGGYIVTINIDGSSSTDHWLGYYGSVIPASENPYDLDDESMILNINRTGGCLLITNSSDAPDPAYLIAGSPDMIDAITGTGSDSGSRTFTSTDIYNIYGKVMHAPTTYTYTLANGSQSPYFKEGFFTERGNLVFAVPVVENATCCNGRYCNFQFMLPNNPKRPITYYVYHFPLIPPYILYTSPERYAVDVPVTANVTATFDRPMDASTINASTVLLNEIWGGSIIGSISYLNTTVTFHPDHLNYSTAYQAVITTGVRDPAGTGLASNHIVIFQTCSPTLDINLTDLTGMDVTTDTGETCIANITATTISLTCLNLTNGTVLYVSIPNSTSTLDIALSAVNMTANTCTVGSIVLNNTPYTANYSAVRPVIGSVTTDLDVVFSSVPAHINFSMTQHASLSNALNITGSADAAMQNLTDAAGAAFAMAFDADVLESSTAVAIHATLDDPEQIAAILINITVGAEWYAIAGGDASRVRLFGINDSTGAVDVLAPASIVINDGSVTFHFVADHLSTFALTGHAVMPEHVSGRGGTYPPAPYVAPAAPAITLDISEMPPVYEPEEKAAPEPGEETPEMRFPRRHKLGIRDFTLMILFTAAGIFAIYMVRRSHKK